MLTPQERVKIRIALDELISVAAQWGKLTGDAEPATATIQQLHTIWMAIESLARLASLSLDQDSGGE